MDKSTFNSVHQWLHKKGSTVDDIYDDKIKELLNKYLKPFRDSVNASRKNWNNIIREHIRSSTAFSLSSDNVSISISVNISDRIPEPFLKILNQYSSTTWDLLFNLEKLRASRDGLEYALGSFEINHNIVKQANKKDIENSLKYVYELIKHVEECGILDSIKNMHGDILGAYFYALQNPRIELYWIAIAAIARVLNCSIEDLTIVVLAHELSHAYTHKGYDIDKKIWDTNYFQSADLKIVEGLAQFYTKEVCKKLAYRKPGSLTAFESLLKYQSEAYTCFKDWAKEDETKGEDVRAAMLRARRENITEYEKFIENFSGISDKKPVQEE